jgi:hypothetical protein
VVKLYALRMKIEEAFRDVKSTRFGLSLELHRTYQVERLQILLLIATLALMVAWLMGKATELTGQHRHYQANTSETASYYRRSSLASKSSMIHAGRYDWRTCMGPSSASINSSKITACLSENRGDPTGAETVLRMGTRRGVVMMRSPARFALTGSSVVGSIRKLSIRSNAEWVRASSSQIGPCHVTVSSLCSRLPRASKASSRLAVARTSNLLGDPHAIEDVSLNHYAGLGGDAFAPEAA